MKIRSQLLHKHVIVVTELAEYFLALEEGSKIDTVEELADRMKVGRGTVQTAIKELVELSCINYENRGRNGSIITYINFDKLVSVSGITNVVGCMPLPYSKRYEGLATGLYTVLNKGEINVSLAFMTGSKNRFDALNNNNYDFTVVSKLAAQDAISRGCPIEIITNLGEETFTKNHILILNEDIQDIEDGVRIGVDLSSSDQVFITRKYFESKNVTIVPVKYSNIIDMILSDKIDGAIWSADNISLAYKGLKIVNVLSATGKKEETNATIVIKKNNIIVKRFLEHYINIDEIIKIQKQVMDGTIAPYY